jgi:hypothetical protein
MAKTKISELDAAAANNTDINSVDVSEGCAPSGINNAIREMGAMLKRMDNGTDHLTNPNITGDLDVDNININGNTISSTNTNGNVTVDPNGSGQINLSANVDVTGNASITANLPTFTITGQGRANGFEIAGTSGNTKLTEKSNNGIEVGTNNTTRMTITSGGSVGIGTSSPAATTHSHSSSAGGGHIRSSSSNLNNFIDIGTDSGGHGVINVGTAGGTMNFETAGTERMRITSGGRLLIGTTAQNAGYGNNNDGMTLTKSGPTVFSNSASDYGLVLNKTSPQSGSTFYQVNFRSANTNVGGIFTNSSSTTYATTSDYRLKEAVVDMTGAIDRVKALAPKRFNFIADPDTTVDGFLAHEAQAVVPEAVTGTHNEVDENGDAVMQAIDQSKLVPLLSGALREAITKIETLETENSTQATQIADLITRVTALEAS